ncbi:hypothetical protein C461_10341 [Halorubrum aidingense JCM 13560]|uniref:Uncharacterized protein n=1 Tax=Halorubrum aidingense JCM 13560 TaxID=1230454 RepID=M0PA46_9EURY|nr:hypothetical protein [Halorubrum aidingense]EMA66901.1 hypothetical protein C461_10341 [Halorubrum aidingense JCM 13560]
MPDHRRDDDSPSTVSRRSFLGAAAATIGGSLAGIGALAASSRPAAAVDGDPAAFEAGDAPTVTSNEGRVEAVYLSPAVDVSWTDFSEGVETVTLVLAVGSDAGVDEVYRETLRAADPEATPGEVASIDGFDGERSESPPDFGAIDGGLTATFERADTTERGDAVTSESLSATGLSGGETDTTTLDVVFRADVSGGGDEASVVRTTTVDVAVTNPAGDTSAGGTVEVDTA